MMAVDGGGAARRAAMALAMTLLLMWPALINRQPFYFSDTTSYVRAADFVANRLSGGRIVTIWTARYQPPPAPAPTGSAERPATTAVAPANDVRAGNIMSGRSPYFGVLLWLGYVSSDFWLFVAAQALAAWLLIAATLRLFEVAARGRTAVVAVLVLGTGLPFYLGMLMPDALAGLGMLAFLVLAIDRGRLSPPERMLAIGVLLASAVSHLTHILILAAMTAALVVAVRLRRRGLPLAPAVPAGLVAVGLGLVSIAATSLIVTRVFDRPPQLIPLLTSRIIEDGPGRAFIRSGCDGARFAVCALPNAGRADALQFLWSTDPRLGVYMLADPATRARLSAEDLRFFVAAAASDPVSTGLAMARNSFQQLIDFRNQGINQRGWNWEALPSSERAALAASPAGRDLWPDHLLDILHYAAVAAGAVLIVAALRRPDVRASTAGEDLLLWALLVLAGMVVNDVLTGAVSIPQYRYQARIVWIVPLLGTIAAVLLSRTRRQSV